MSWHHTTFPADRIRERLDIYPESDKKEIDEAVASLLKRSTVD